MVQERLWGSSEGMVEEKKRVQVVRVEMVKERTATFATNKVDSPRRAAEMLADFFKNKVNTINVVSVGTLSGATVHPREVFKPAILMAANRRVLNKLFKSPTVIVCQGCLKSSRVQWPAEIILREIKGAWKMNQHPGCGYTRYPIGGCE